MIQRLSHNFRPARRRGFTLIELLVVMGIIILLVSILLPAAGRVRIAAQTTRTNSSMVAIAGAMERYFQDNHAYPGLFSNGQLCGGSFGTMPPITFNPTPAGAGTTLTSSENVAGSLTGSFEGTFDGSGNLTGIVINLDNGSIGKGPLNLSPAVVYRTRKPAYIDPAPGSLFPSQPYSGSGCVAANDADTMGTPGTNPDSGFPEFRDSYSNSPRPILILRANVGVETITRPVCTNMNVRDPTAAQYNTFEFTFYQRGAAPTAPADFPGDFNFGAGILGDFECYASAQDYLRNPSAPFNTSNGVGTPRGKDKFIMISAGPDHCFGTKDDIFYGGN